MFNLVFIEENGLIASYIQIESKTIYNEGQVYDGHTICYVPEELTDLDINTLFRLYYVKDKVFKELPFKESIYLEWDLVKETWVEPPNYLITLRSDNINSINVLSGEKILLKYPFYLQHNLARDVTSIEATTMFTWIDSIRILANTAKTSLAVAATLADIRTAMEVYKTNIALIE